MNKKIETLTVKRTRSMSSEKASVRSSMSDVKVRWNTMKRKKKTRKLRKLGEQHGSLHLDVGGTQEEKNEKKS